jgi:hypothetical protein|tara:strand:+ start:90 stop:278 length:189 start_codon:yes stop_codon:yes gene_type:complete
MEQDPMKRLEAQGVKFEIMAEEELKEFQPMIDAFHEHTAIMAIIQYFTKVAVQNAITKEMIE